MTLFLERSLPPGDRDEPRVAEPVAGHELVVAQINRALADAVSWAIQVRAAMNAGSEPDMQLAANAAAISAQTAHVLLRSLAKRIAIHRARQSRVRG